MDFAAQMFFFSNTLILPFWLLLIFFPRTKLTRRVFANPNFNPMQLLRLSGIKLFAHRFLPKISPQSAFTTPPLRLPVSLLFPNFAIWQGNPPKSPLIPRCIGQKWQTAALLGQFG
ncbi:MAG: DUF4281 domain-containing protein [Betaproteobacteria bacterium]|nr:DUF4281 domain-containing protein [Betaproteobacteria bacterium]